MTRYGILIVDMEEICIEEQWFPNFRIHSAIAGIEKLRNFLGQRGSNLQIYSTVDELIEATIQ